MAEVADLIIKVTTIGGAEAERELARVGAAVDEGGDEARTATISWDVLKAMLGEVGQSAVKSAVEMGVLKDQTDSAADEIDRLNRQLAGAGLLRGGGAFFGGGGGRGIATDLGSSFHKASGMAQSFLSILTLIAPTINIIIAGVVGLVGLLTSAVVAATALLAALAAVGGAMALAAFKWRNLWAGSTDGVDHMRGAFLAVEESAFESFNRIRASFERSGAGNIWDSLAEAADAGIKKMEPLIQGIVDKVLNFADALRGVPGASSPFLDFIRTWLEEWKRLRDIVNEGIPGGGGLLGFFQKYEKPAKAFVEGIAQVINGVRKMSAMGLGLNMDQLAELIRNVFTWLQKLIQVFPRFSNALVTVGLQVSRFINAMMPIVEQAFIIGSAILEHIVAPLVNGLLKAINWLLNLPFIRWLTELAGGFLLVAVAISKLTGNLIPFRALIDGTVIKAVVNLGNKLLFTFGLITDGQGVIRSITSQFPRLGAAIQGVVGWATRLGSSLTFGKLSGGKAALVGFGAAIAGVAAATWVLSHAMDAYSASQVRMRKEMDKTIEAMGRGDLSIEAAKQQLIGIQVESLNTMSNWEKLGYGITHLGQVFQQYLSTSTYGIIPAPDVLAGMDTEAQKTIQEALAEIGGNAKQSIYEVGALTDTQAKYLNSIKHSADGSLIFADVLEYANAQYENGTINAGQYATILEQLGVDFVSAADGADLMTLKLRGAANTISQALLEVRDAADTVTGGLRDFALSSGQDFVKLRQDALDAINDVQGGIMGTGEKVTEFFMQQQQTIEQWKNSTADAFNFVTTAFQNLAGQANLTFAKVREALQNAIGDARDYQDNWDQLVRMGASNELLRQIQALGQGGGVVMEAIIQGGKDGVKEVNGLVKRGGDLASALADDMAQALGVTLERLTAAFTIMVANQLGLKVSQVERRIDRMVGNVNDSTKKLKDRTININFRTQRAPGLAARYGSEFGPTRQIPDLIPKPNTAQIRNDYRDAGREAMTGFGEGIKGSDAGKNAAKQAGEDAVEATRKAIGAASPATKFIAIGEDAMAGFGVGIDRGASRVAGQMSGVGMQVISGFKAGLTAAAPALYETAQQIADHVKTIIQKAYETDSPSRWAYRIGRYIADGLRFGMRDGIGAMERDMQGHVRRLQTGWGYSTGTGARDTRVRGTLAFDWRSGQADLEGAMAWENRNAL